MITRFISLEWKKFFRSASFGKSVGLKILMGFFALYFIVAFGLLGFGGYFLIKDKYPNQDPFLVVNSFLLFAIVGDLMFRYLMQKLPVLNVKPFLTMPVKKNTLINYLLVKSSFSFFNIVWLFFYIPFSLILIKEGYNTLGVLGWLFFVIVLVQSSNFFNFLVNRNTKVFIGMLVILAGGYLIQRFQIFNLGEYVGQGFQFIYNNPIYALSSLLLLVFLYRTVFNQLKNQIYLDEAVSEKIEEAKTVNLSFIDGLGDVSTFIKNDLRLIMRNKRTKSSLFILAIALLYGLFFYPNPAYSKMEFFPIFVGIFSTGAFLINFGQFIPAWDSSYYNMLMTQNFKYEKYLKSKFMLMSISVILMFVLGIPYVYFGWKILVIHFVAMIYNIGVNTHVIMFGGSFNRKKINLNEKAAFNYQGTGAVQWLIGIPLMLLPMGLFAALNYWINFEIAVATIAILGFLGLALHKFLMTAITKKYIANKYLMVHSFKQEG